MAIKGNKKVHKSKKQQKSTSKVKKGALGTKKFLIFGAIVLAIAIFAVGMGTIVNKSDKEQKTSVSGSNTLVLESNSKKVKTGDTVVVKLYSNSQTNVNAVQAAIRYPDNILELKEVKTSNSAYPIQAYQSTNNATIELVRGAIGGVTGKQLVGEIEFVAINTGDAQLSFEDDKTTLVESSTNTDVLANSNKEDTVIEVQ